MAVKKSNLVAFRLSDPEYEFLENSVDYFQYDSVSAVIRGLIRQAMKNEVEDLQSSQVKS
ncbi:MAG: hypothetical protein K2P14_11000 [Anaeroplasmataceae bacterium]|nr:hypothetical protein [Anaeroplasmataceae bacterium]